MNNNSSTDTYKNAGGLSASGIIDGNIRDLKIKLGIDNIPIENHRLPNMYWMPKMCKNPINARFIIVSPKSCIKPLARTIKSVFCLFFRQIQTYNDKCRFCTGVNTFRVVQNNKPVIDAMNGLNKRRKATSVSTFDFSSLYAKLPHNNDFCFDGARWVNNIKDNAICLNKQQIKDAVAYLLLNCYFTVGPKIFCQIFGIPMGFDPAPFLPTYSYTSVKVSV